MSIVNQEEQLLFYHDFRFWILVVCMILLTAVSV